MKNHKKTLGINIDHIATLRQQRKENDPDLLRAAKVAVSSGADQLTVHLREDRRHIQDADIYNLINKNFKINFECAATDEMLDIILKTKPEAVCLVPEKREELTTEGGLDISCNTSKYDSFISKVREVNIPVSVFINPNPSLIKIAKQLNVDAIEIHTGNYADAFNKDQNLMIKELNKIKKTATLAKNSGLQVNAGHGLNFDNIGNIVSIMEITEYNIGHSIISESIFIGLANAIKKIKSKIIEQ